MNESNISLRIFDHTFQVQTADDPSKNTTALQLIWFSRDRFVSNRLSFILAIVSLIYIRHETFFYYLSKNKLMGTLFFKTCL